MGSHCVYLFLIFTLKKLQNYSRTFIFVSATEIGENVTNIVNSFFRINIHFGTWNKKSAWRKLILLLIRNIYVAFSFLEIQRSNADQSILQGFCLSLALSVCLSLSLSVCLSVSLSVCLSVCLPACLSLSLYLSISEKKGLANLQKKQKAAAKKLFLQCAYYRYNLLRWTFFIPRDNWKTLLFTKMFRCSDVFFHRHIVALFWRKCLERSPYFVSYLHNNNAILI